MKTFRLSALGACVLCFYATMPALASPFVAVPVNAVWKYLGDGTDLGRAWISPAFDDSSWLSGAAQLGYGDGDETTVVTTDLPRPPTVYFRRTIVLPAGVSNATLRLLRDDGAVVYVNGIEVLRNNMPAGSVTFHTLAVAAIGGAEETSVFIDAAIPSDAFVAGANVIAVEIHQNGLASSDMSFALELSVDSGPPPPVVTVEAIVPETREIPPWLDQPVIPAVFRISRTGTNGALAVSLRLGGTAINGLDYDFGPSAIIEPGSRSTEVYVFPNDDDLAEGTESVVLTLLPGPCLQCYAVGEPATATAYILDDDATNTPPTVWISRPQEGATFTAPANIFLRAVAYDREDGYDIAVEFFEGANKIGNATFIASLCPAVDCPSWDLTWRDVPPGRYTLTARATDKAGAVTVSPPVHVTVTGSNTPPERTIINVVATDAQATEPGLNTNPALTSGTFTFYRTGNLDAEVTVFFTLGGSASNGVDYLRITNRVVIPPLATQAVVHVLPRFDNLPEGTETVVLTLEPVGCIAIFPPPPECYLVGPSDQATVFIDDWPPPTNRPPFVQLNQPLDSAVFTAPATIPFQAYAQDTEDGHDLNVEFFEGTNRLGAGTFVATLCPAPYCPYFAFTWSNAPPGSYTLTAKATDSEGAMSVSAPVHITVGQPPTNRPPEVVIVTPHNGDSFPAGTGIWLGANVFTHDAGVHASLITSTNGASKIFAVSSDRPFSSRDANNNIVARAFPLPADIPDGKPDKPGGTNLFAIIFEPPDVTVQRIYVTNSIFHDAAGDIIGVLSHSDPMTGTDVSVTLNNHRTWTGLETVVYDDSEQGDLEINSTLPVIPPDGPGSLRSFVGQQAFGVWNFSISDNAQFHTGVVAELTLVIEPASTNSDNPVNLVRTILPQRWVYAGLNVPADATNVQICVQTDGLVDLYARRSDFPTFALFDKALTGIAPPGSCPDVGLNDSPPLNPGRYFVGVYNPSASTSVRVHLAVAIQRSLNRGPGVQRVDFYTGSTLIGQAIGPLPGPSGGWGLSWSNPPVGNHVLRAVATDTTGLRGTSAPVNITVFGSGGTNLPIVRVFATDSNAVETAGSMVNTGRFTFTRSGDLSNFLGVFFVLSGTASNGVDYVLGTNVVAFPPGASNAHLIVTPIDDAQSEPAETVVLRVVPPPPTAFALPYRVGSPSNATVFIRDSDVRPTNQAPVVTLHFPQEGEVFTAPANIHLRAAAQDPEDGFQIRVEFFAGTNRVGVGTFIPSLCPSPWCPSFDLTWSNVPPGNYTLTVKATDEAGAMTLSAPIHITVTDDGGTNTLPVVTVRAIASGTAEDEALQGAPLPPIGFNFSRSGPTNHALTVRYEMGGTAINGVDYTPLPGTAQIPAGASNVLVIAHPIDDSLIEGDETVTVSIKPGDCSPVFPTSSSLRISGQGSTGLGGWNLSVFAEVSANGTNGSISVLGGATGPVLQVVPPHDGCDCWCINARRTDVDIVGPDFRENVYIRDTGDGLTTFDQFALISSIGGDCNTFSTYGLHFLSLVRGDFEVETPDGDGDGVPDYKDWCPDTAPGAGVNEHGCSIDQIVDCGSYRVGDPNRASVLIRDNDGRPTNEPPVVTLHFPREGEVFTVPADILLRAAAQDAEDGFQIRVEFFAGTNRIGAGTFIPTLCPAPWCPSFDFTWSNVPPGRYTLTAKATDHTGAMTLSAPVHITVVGDPVPTLVRIEATGRIAEESSEPFRRLNLVGEFAISRAGPTNEPVSVFVHYSGSATPGVDYPHLPWIVTIPAGSRSAEIRVMPENDRIPEGIETLVATLSDCPPNTDPALGMPCFATQIDPVHEQATVFIRDDGITEASLAITKPTDGASFRAGEILIEATAIDLEGYISRVEFWDGEQQIGVSEIFFIRPPDPGTPVYHSFEWPGTAPGSHVLTARAVRADATAVQSQPVNIIVQGEPPADRELHAVSIYSGNFNGGSSPHHERGDASVVVNRPGKRVSLFLSSYEPVLWHVSVASNTVIEKVILGGYYRQEIDGIGSNVPVIARYYDEGHGSGDYLWPGTSLDSGRFFRVLQKLCDLMGMDLASFQGTGTAPYPTPFVIDQVQNDPRLRCDYPQPVDPSQVPDLSFRLAFHDGSTVGGLFFQDYTLHGVVNAARLLPAWRVVTDGGGRYYYGADFHRAWNVDAQSGAVVEMQIPAGLPEFSWPVGIAFDSQRNRILVATLVGEGYLYAYSPASSQWSLVSSLQNEDLDSLVYHAPNDSLYGVKAAYYDGGAPALLRFNASGQLTGQIALPVQPYGVGFGGFRSELVSVGEYIVLLLETENYIVDNGRPEARIYLIDPRNGEVSLTYRRATQRDSDRDGVADEEDRCPNTPSGVPVDAHGCSADQRDSDHDGVMDSRDQCPNTPPAVPVDQHGCPLRSLDSDGDGVPNYEDNCPNTPAGAVVNEEGCSIAQTAPCDGRWRNHGEYVNAVRRAAFDFYRAGLITRRDRQEVIRDAARSECGRRRPRLNMPVQSADEIRTNGCRLILAGDSPGTCIVESSVDLIHWTPISTNRLSGAAVHIEDPGAWAVPRRFYRARLQ